MTSHIETIVKKHELNLLHFEVAKKNFYKHCGIKIIKKGEKFNFENKSLLKENAHNSFNEICEKLQEILNICAIESKVKEKNNIYRSYSNTIIPKVAFYTEFSNIEITIGLYQDFYITTRINNANNINLMPDKFWQMLFRLSNIGKFKFQEEHKISSDISKRFPHLFNKRGNIYKLIRNYFLNQVEYGSCNSLGFLTVSWSNETPFDKLIILFVETFSIMYKLNYMLGEKK